MSSDKFAVCAMITAKNLVHELFQKVAMTKEERDQILELYIIARDAFDLEIGLKERIRNLEAIIDELTTQLDKVQKEQLDEAQYLLRNPND